MRVIQRFTKTYIFYEQYADHITNIRFIICNKWAQCHDILFKYQHKHKVLREYCCFLEIAQTLYTENGLTVLTWRWHGKLPEHLCVACGKGVSLSLSFCLPFTHCPPAPPPSTCTHIYPVYPVLWTQRPLASRPEKTSLKAIGCPILFQASHSQPHLFNAYIQSWGHEVGMWQGAKGALDLGIISAYRYCDFG